MLKSQRTSTKESMQYLVCKHLVSLVCASLWWDVNTEQNEWSALKGGVEGLQLMKNDSKSVEQCCIITVTSLHHPLKKKIPPPLFLLQSPMLQFTLKIWKPASNSAGSGIDQPSHILMKHKMVDDEKSFFIFSIFPLR